MKYDMSNKRMSSRRKRKISYIDLGSSESIPFIPFIPRKIQRLDDSCSNPCKCQKKNDENYFMRHKKRGKAIIFNHNICHGHLLPRRGTEYDVRRLGKTLSNVLKFEVKVYEDLKHCEIMEVLGKLSRENFSQEDCLAIFVLTHGSLHGLTAADARYSVEDLWTNFLPPKCSTLAGKPKLFFVNSCRGKNFDEGHIYGTQDAEAINEGNTKSTCYRAPIYADFLTFYSTMEGFTSLRHPYDGSWFIQSLCETLENKNYRKLELKQILTVATRKTALKCNEYSERVCQVPTIMSTLLRNLYFS